MSEMETYIKERLTATPPEGVPFEVGEKVIWVNDYGVVWQGSTIIGFSTDPSRPNCHIHLGKDAYWFALNTAQVYKADDLTPFYRAYSPEHGYLGLDEYQCFCWKDDPEEAELFHPKRLNKSVDGLTNFIVDGEPHPCSFIPAVGCQAFNSPM
ncbi:hypothetical protein [Vibrio fluvialis]|uniref:hypothetical protein n=1 Tax=Vibrio fluvialis TaxID=676 RepID=UPI0023A92C4A|nr:hypothetical protein [Vibrio fluvialis]MDE5179210.1 hypothetical protein [Vibrio fluvialis]